MKKIVALVLTLFTAAWAGATTCAAGSRCSGSLTAAGTASGVVCSASAACVVLPLISNSGAAVVTLSGTFSQTVQFEGTGDGGLHWVNVQATPIPPGPQVSSTGSTGTWKVDVSGLTHLQLRCSAFTSGTVVVVINTSPAPPVVVGTATDPSGNEIVVGPAAAGATAAGNPVQVGCISQTIAGLPAPSNGQIEPCFTDPKGRIYTQSGALAAATDAVANNLISTFGAGTNTSGAPLEVGGFTFNGTTWDRGRSASLANMPMVSTSTGRNSIGALITENGSRWSVNSQPAVSAQATASLAAEASVRHVVTGVCFSAAATTAPSLTQLSINLRDGATGAGTVIKSWVVAIPASTGQLVAPNCFQVGPIVMTINTATTLEFSALLTNLFEQVSLEGFNVN